VTPYIRRFVRRSSQNEILVYTDGACLDNSQQNPKAGCALVFHPPTVPIASRKDAYDGKFSFRLETNGPNGDPQPQTSNRAELRAVIGALQFRIWVGEEWTRLLMATDSEYVVSGATGWTRGWERNGWMTAKKIPVKSRDLWELLLKEIRKHAEMGLAILFWRIPRELNKDADEAAKAGALLEEQQNFRKFHGVMAGEKTMFVVIKDEPSTT
jgi:ribonuclease HI